MRQAVDVLAVEALAQAAIFDARQRGDGRHQVVVPLHRIRREIGDPDEVGFGHEADGQDAVGVAGAVDPGPILAVDRDAGLIVGPAVGIGGAAAIGDPERHFATARAGQAEVEPLVEIAHVILDDLEIDACRRAASTTRMLPASNALEIVMVMHDPWLADNWLSGGLIVPLAPMGKPEGSPIFRRTAGAGTGATAPGRLARNP